jgi:hypothetical protein
MEVGMKHMEVIIWEEADIKHIMQVTKPDTLMVAIIINMIAQATLDTLRTTAQAMEKDTPMLSISNNSLASRN